MQTRFIFLRIKSSVHEVIMLSLLLYESSPCFVSTFPYRCMPILFMDSRTRQSAML